MKIAFVNLVKTIASPVENGDSVKIWTHRIAKRLRHVSEIFLYGGPDLSRSTANYSEAHIHYRGISTRRDEWLRAFRILDRLGILNSTRPFWASRFYYRGNMLRVAKDLHEQQCDIIHIFDYSQFIPIIRAQNPQSKIVLHMHMKWLHQLDRTMIASRLACTDLVIGCSDYVTQNIRDRFPEFADRCRTVANGVDTDTFLPAPNGRKTHSPSKFRLLFVGRISPEKGLHTLLNSLPKIVERYPGLHLDIIGPDAPATGEFVFNSGDEKVAAKLAKYYRGNYLTQLKQTLTSDLNQYVSFLGSMEHDKLLQHYWDADIVVLPSLSETFGMPLVEAMATETPVIATRIEGMIDVVDENQTGLLIEPDNADALANAVIRLLGNNELRQSMGRAGRERVTTLFTWDKVANNLIESYRYLGADFD